MNCILSITPQLIVLGLKDGSLRLFDATSNKIIFYPHSYIVHSKEIIYLCLLGSTKSKQKRIASSSQDNEIIIWTLGENNVLYPERKLERFSSEIIRIMDLEDGAHIVISDEQGELKILNYHDNQIRYRDGCVGQVCDIIYLMKMERFVCVSQQG